LIIHNTRLMPLLDCLVPLFGPNVISRIGTNQTLRHEHEFGMRSDIRGSMAGESRTRPTMSNKETR
jgi:hypothetical protein